MEKTGNLKDDPVATLSLLFCEDRGLVIERQLIWWSLLVTTASFAIAPLAPIACLFSIFFAYAVRSKGAGAARMIRRSISNRDAANVLSICNASGRKRSLTASLSFEVVRGLLFSRASQSRRFARLKVFDDFVTPRLLLPPIVPALREATQPPSPT